MPRIPQLANYTYQPHQALRCDAHAVRHMVHLSGLSTHHGHHCKPLLLPNPCTYTGTKTLLAQQNAPKRKPSAILNMASHLFLAECHQAGSSTLHTWLLSIPIHVQKSCPATCAVRQLLWECLPDFVTDLRSCKGYAIPCGLIHRHVALSPCKHNTIVTPTLVTILTKGKGRCLSKFEW